jgi:hypothetical protein
MASKVTKKKVPGKINQEALEEAHRIRKAFKDKDWAEIKSSDSWMIFKVMSEFVGGFEKLGQDWALRYDFWIGTRKTQPSVL